jgi:hypothetical protein
MQITLNTTITMRTPKANELATSVSFGLQFYWITSGLNHE